MSVLFLVLFWAAVTRLHNLLAFFPQSDRMRFPTQKRPPSGACSPLGSSYSGSCHCSTCLCIRFRKHLTHTHHFLTLWRHCAPPNSKLRLNHGALRR